MSLNDKTFRSLEGRKLKMALWNYRQIKDKSFRSIDGTNGQGRVWFEQKTISMADQLESGIFYQTSTPLRLTKLWFAEIRR